MGYATSNAKPDQCVDELFQYGYAFWTGKQDYYAYLILYDRSGSHNDTRHGTWQRYRDTYTGEPLPTRIPPPGWYQPKGGIGKVWLEKLGGPNAAIGWTNAEYEREFYGRYQYFEKGFMFWSDLFGVSVLFEDGTWQRIGGRNL